MPDFSFPSPIPAFRIEALEGVYADLPECVVTGLWPHSSAEESLVSNWVDIAMPNKGKPPSQFVSEDLDTYTFSVIFRAPTPTDSIAGQIRLLKSFKKPDAMLGRPPEVRFSCGDIVFVGVITQIRLRYSEPWHSTTGSLFSSIPGAGSHLGTFVTAVDKRLDRTSAGRLKQVDADVTLRELREPVPIAEFDPTAPPTGSRWHVARGGETFEETAKLEYGHPGIGIALRQDHPFCFPAAGDFVYLPSQEAFVRRLRLPESHVLSDADDVVAARKAVFDWLDGTRTVP